MSEFGAALQAYNQEIVKCLEELKRKREEMLDIICKQETNKSVLERNINVLKGKLDVLNERLDRDKSIFEQYEHTIKETEEGFKKSKGILYP
ncbi:unnamed protein product [Acanthoscelides obtectus]|uniref:Uncharacterized protein n=1 Tax=Acanthoscelides obtectus TaxID=200917 RepID=A0A9P0K2J2_ACAOB|nr:unnamed protein product [Acanthoscelides obtectus]CAK1632548.1 Sjoegren syndrome nuclear autoantigen 1 homolog [Acanthoscelides obtectus]